MNLEDKERRDEILKKIEKAGSEEYLTEWDSEGRVGIQKKKSEVKKGKKSRKKGANFELKVRRDLESKAWIVDKWSNNVEFGDSGDGKIVPAKRKFNPFSKVMTIGTGFPDFICFQLLSEGKYNVIGVEVKLNGILSKEEKEKCIFLLNKKVFKHIWIAKNTEKGIEYIDFKERYKNKII